MLEHAGWVPFACVIAAIMTIAVAGITWVTSPHWGNNKVQAQAKARNIGAIPTAPASPHVVADIVSPNRIEIPKIHAVAPIVPVGTTADRELEIPLNPKRVGWWKYGAKPGATKGTAILAGHINYAGVTGPMATIGKLNPGDAVFVFGTQNADRRHEVRFVVTGVRTYHKTHLPYNQIFDQKSIGRIAIVTCGGPFDASTGNYLDNIVVFAVPDPNSAKTSSHAGIPGVSSPPTGPPARPSSPSSSASGSSRPTDGPS
jgi:Sortase domain